MADKTKVAVYYFPNYHIDPRNEARHGKGWTEWELVKQATPRFAGHQQPKVPLWGMEDEADPQVMARKIKAADEHGIDAFIFDWYWYEDAPYLHGALERGFLKADNADKLRFALMWANHDWLNIFPASKERNYEVLTEGTVMEQQFVQATDYMIEHYFHHTSYWRVEGGLYFSIYELMNLVKGLGGNVLEVRRILSDFRTRVRTAGLGELHLNAIVWGIQNLPGEETITDVNALMDLLDFDSITSYVWIHHQELPHYPDTDYSAYRELNIADFVKFTETYTRPYFPNVSMGWDSSPRTVQNESHENIGYPYTPILVENTPKQFKLALQQAKQFLEQGRTNPPILTINSWNEWTEGSYLEPDTVHGIGYLEAIRDVFIKE
ncbi:Glycosyltransferase WbsX [Paenibacillus sp. yr247]|uniref:glycosyltransferase WbsX family protein n=1 Tax=Paenibacillus sp. yr247 TaxID=1761880 RepID=UPI000882F134|nr:glycoside hydrolase family 99-like domain-containing protein [Paenibacillus sp. yr247]SDM85402.1 Glycosyltransferase WbsX [Paenibacillus sp. yr247]